MQLVLVRHGKAEDPAARSSDLERELTTTGRSTVKGMAQGLRLCVSGKVVIWTSPLPRARQTADILANAFKVKKVREHDAIAAGDLEVLASDWRDLDPQPKALILVGHQPHLGNWAERITGAVLPIKTAAALAVDLDEDGALSGMLRWYAHPKVLASLADR
ncbi:phosphohistidine phosphatase SixA [Acidithiobacillus ferridurans]|uniref:phosphohistidine phosphatase SixA n=1 Tax=Acidithiobacillus ferridurans TaxID=1232575 RepID=UPI000DE2DD37|nr:phosphohistidine phosphatase SixA [Acidithiobacillus ferridurans]RBM01472.1 phosphohistidine phosphatase SixA [Acidithiobacillus ferridurans]